MIVGLSIVASATILNGAVAQTDLLLKSHSALGVYSEEQKFTNNVQANYDLTNEEKSRTLNIIQNDNAAEAILNKENWKVLGIGSWIKDNQKIGAFALIKFNDRIWVEGTFTDPNSGNNYETKQWVGSMHAYVDLTRNKLVSLLPVGISKAPDRAPDAVPFMNEKITRAGDLALAHKVTKDIQEPVKYSLAGVRTNAQYPDGIAFFSIVTDQNEEKALVAVDLGKMTVIEDYTGKVARAGQ